MQAERTAAMVQALLNKVDVDSNCQPIPNFFKASIMLGTVLLVILILLLLGAVPAWPHSRNWGYAPSGGLSLIVIILLILLLMGRI